MEVKVDKVKIMQIYGGVILAQYGFEVGGSSSSFPKANAISDVTAGQVFCWSCQDLV